MKELVLPDRSDSTWSSALIPTTPEDVNAPLTPLPDAIAEAMANRPEIAEVKINGEINEKDIRYYREQTKPQVNLTAHYSRAGLAGVVLPPGPNPFTLAFGPLTNQINALSTLAGLSGPSRNFVWKRSSPFRAGGKLWAFAGDDMGWRFSYHGNSTEYLSAYPQPDGGRKFGKVPGGDPAHQESDAADRTEHSIRRAHRHGELQMAQLRLQAAQVARESAEEQYQSEQRQFRAGTSTLFLVQQRQATMITARSQERRSQSDLSEAIALLQLATGTILAERHIVLK